MVKPLSIQPADELRNKLRGLKDLELRYKKNVTDILEVLDEEGKTFEGAVRYWKRESFDIGKLLDRLEFVIRLISRSKRRLRIVLLIIHKEEGVREHLETVIRLLNDISAVKGGTLEERKSLKIYENLEERDEHILYEFGKESIETRKIIGDLLQSLQGVEQAPVIRNCLMKARYLSETIHHLLSASVNILRAEHSEIKELMDAVR
jgi:hypothetical protein